MKETSSLRQQEIVEQYFTALNRHLVDLKSGKAEATFRIKDIADILCMHPRHLSNTINEVLGTSPCDIYESKLLAIAQELLLETNMPIADIARRMTYDPSNFTKFFKALTGLTPKKYREIHKN
jgi:AraC family transcriptional regulator, regulatory protein of adaptative response / methylphosphotriester-DNA alkyltransferase methyltransferase